MINNINAERLYEKIKRHEDIQILDVRNLESCKSEHIIGAICEPVDNIDLDMAIDKFKLDKNKETIVYCSSKDCTSSPLAAEKLEKMGFSKVERFAEGLSEWKEKHYPTERGIKS